MDDLSLSSIASAAVSNYAKPRGAAIYGVSGGITADGLGPGVSEKGSTVIAFNTLLWKRDVLLKLPE